LLLHHRWPSSPPAATPSSRRATVPLHVATTGSQPRLASPSHPPWHCYRRAVRLLLGRCCGAAPAAAAWPLAAAGSRQAKPASSPSAFTVTTHASHSLLSVQFA
jgi:hypothetical protein